MKHYTEITKCRVCGNTELVPILDLGVQALTGVFPATRDEEVPSGPIQLVKCHSYEGRNVCDLVQLKQSYKLSDMYGASYGYRSSLNASMVAHLKDLAEEATAHLKIGDLVVDIGSNDGTLLSQYSISNERIGIDPLGFKFTAHYPPGIKLISDFFRADLLEGKKAKIITSVAMFYDLEDPVNFAREVKKCLHPDGVWIFEQSYLKTMLEQTSYDTVCAEHLEYYGLRQIKWILDEAGLQIVKISDNKANGGSIRITAVHSESDAASLSLLTELHDEISLQNLEVFEKFRADVFRHRNLLWDVVEQANKEGTVCGYGASTKGNVILQFCGFTEKEIPAILEVNTEKFGRYTPGSKIPILAQNAGFANANTLLVLPWHFKDTIVKHTGLFRAEGGKLIFPLPKIEIVAEAKKLPDEEYKKYLATMPIVCVDVLVYRYNTKTPVNSDEEYVLLLKRTNDPAKGEWWFPGGRVHHGECREDAAKRKLQEETGIIVRREQLDYSLCVEDVILPMPDGSKSHAVSTFFYVNVNHDTAITLDSQSNEYKWTKISEITNPILRKAISAFIITDCKIRLRKKI